MASFPGRREAGSGIQNHGQPSVRIPGWPSAWIGVTPRISCIRANARAVMGEFAIGQAVPRFEDPRLLRGGGRYVDDIVLPNMAFGTVLRSPHAHARIRRIDTAAAKAAPGVLAVLTGADWASLRLWRPAGARRPQAPGRLAQLPAALSRAGQGSGALGRRLRRVRGGRDQEPGDGRRRTDRGRLRAAAGGGRHRRRRQAGRAARLGGLQGQHLLRCRSTATRPQPTPPSRAPPTWSSSGSSSTASPAPPWSRAARSATTIRPTAITRSTPHCSARTAIARNWPRTFSRCPRARCGWWPATSAAASA